LATYRGIGAVGQTIVGLLKEASTDTEFAAQRFELFQPSDFSGPNPIQEGVSLYLFRVAVNTSRRNMPPGVGPDGQRFKPPVPVDLYYLLTPWAKSAVKQHRLLGWAIRELQNVTVLPASVLNYYAPERDTFRPSETVELVFETMTPQELENIVNPMKLTQPLSVCYVARTVMLESTVPYAEAGPVQTRVFDYGEVTQA
jgi:hypothetical protein